MPLFPKVLEREARCFRSALEEYLRQHPEVNLSTNVFNPLRGRFPTDCCKATSFLFGHHLSKLVDRKEIKYVWGQRADGDHGWLQHNGYIVDLTADQFDGEDRSVIVVPEGTSPLHQTFEPQFTYPFEPTPGHKFEEMAEEIANLMMPDS